MSAFSSQGVQDIIGIIAIIGGTLVYTKSRIPQQTVKNLQALTDTYEKRIVALEQELKENHKIQLENVAAIAALEGQIKVYKELPLQELADGIKVNNDISHQILATLQATAQINAEDRSALNGQDVHIKTEVHKTVEQTK